MNPLDFKSSCLIDAMDNNFAFKTLDLILKGGPSWGFRIKQTANKVIISKVNCGGRAHKNGLKVGDEIIAVNNCEIDKHPPTLIRQTDEIKPEDIDDVPLKLTKLDFTYQLIKHTLNRQLHLKVRRQSDMDTAKICCFKDDKSKKARSIHFFSFTSGFFDKIFYFS